MFQYTPYALIILAAGLICAILAISVWRRRPGTGIVPFTVLVGAVAVWSLSSAAEHLINSLPVKLVLHDLTFLGVVTVPTAYLIFVLEYTGRERFLNRRTLLGLLVFPLLTDLVILTNPLHNLFWSEMTLEELDGLAILLTSNGPAFWAHAAYSYLMLLTGALLLIQSFIRSPQLYRGQVGWLLIGTFMPWLANAVFIFNLSPLPPYIDLTSLAFTVTGASFAWSLYRYRLMDIMPIARDAVIDSIVDGVVVLDDGHRIVEANPAALRIFGVKAEDVIGKQVGEVLPDQSRLVEKYRSVTQAEDEITVKVDNRQLYFALRITPIFHRQGDLRGRIILLHDITELKQANEKLQQARQKADEANHLKSQFLATMSHELRTPLNAISGFTELMLEGMTGDLSEMQTGNLERIFANARDLRHLIDDLLDLAKIEAGRTEIVKKPFAVADWLETLVEQTRSLAEEKNLEFVAQLDPDMPEAIVGDPSRLKQITINLLSNAFKFTEEGEVRLEVQRIGQADWAIRVSDTGMGIPSHAQEVIFEKFRQIDGSSQRKYGGSGLGLAIVRELALMMGGGIRVTSTPGEGSIFTVLLPLTAAESVSAQTNVVKVVV